MSAAEHAARAAPLQLRAPGEAPPSMPRHPHRRDARRLRLHLAQHPSAENSSRGARGPSRPPHPPPAPPAGRLPKICMHPIPASHPEMGLVGLRPWGSGPASRGAPSSVLLTNPRREADLGPSPGLSLINLSLILHAHKRPLPPSLAREELTDVALSLSTTHTYPYNNETVDDAPQDGRSVGRGVRTVPGLEHGWERNPTRRYRYRYPER